ncbi:MAG: hypothetical protein JSS51_08725 [Planctomycetes bacterium]|nr:hypothetical protein [Planctomycetota bacterium]
MMMPAWVAWLSGALLAGAGSFLVFSGLLADRLAFTGKRRRCPRCAFDMASTAGLRCTECGHQASREELLTRPFIRWRQVFLGLLLLGTGTAFHAFAAGSIFGWRQVAPTSLLVRCAPLIGREAALRALCPPNPFPLQAYEARRYSPATLAKAENIAIEIFEDPHASVSELVAAGDTIRWMGEVLRQPGRLAKVLASRGNHEMIPLLAWNSAFYAALLCPEVELPREDVLRTLAKLGTNGQDLAVGMLSRGLAPQWAELVPDLFSQGLFSGVTFDEIEYVHPEVKARLLKRCREIYFAGDDTAKINISRFLWTNGRYVPAGNKDVEMLARDQITRYACGERSDLLSDHSFILWQASEMLSGLIPEIAGMLSNPWSTPRTRASEILRTVKLDSDRTAKLIDALAEVIATGSDEGRLEAMNILTRRRLDTNDLVQLAVLNSIAHIRIPRALHAAMPLLVDTTDNKDGTVDVARVRVSAPALRQALCVHLTNDSPCGPVAARWLAILPAADAELLNQLTAVANDPVKSPALRAAARDAILHIQDRAVAAESPPLEQRSE